MITECLAGVYDDIVKKIIGGALLSASSFRSMQVQRQTVRILQAQLGANVGLVAAGALVYAQA